MPSTHEMSNIQCPKSYTVEAALVVTCIEVTSLRRPTFHEKSIWLYQCLAKAATYLLSQEILAQK